MNNHIFVFVRILFLMIIVLVFNCDNPTEPDKTPPSIVITSPVDGTTVSEIVTITAVASDNEGIKKVVLFVDGYQIEGIEDDEEPYELKWNTVQYSDNSKHTILTRAFDKNDNIKDSDPIILTVNNIAARPKQVNLNNIKYENFAFILSWPQSFDDDFDFYTLYEALSKDMSGENSIYTSNIRSDTTYTVLSVNEDEERFYRLTVTDSLGLETSSLIKSKIASSIPLDGLLLYYPFNGNANDESGNGFNGVVNGAVLTIDLNNNPNSAYSFDGIDDFIDVPTSASLAGASQISVGAFVKWRLGTNRGMIYFEATSTGTALRWFLAVLPTAEIMVSWRDAPEDPVGSLKSFQTTEKLLEDTWYHLATVWDSNTDNFRIYVNGDLSASYSIPSDPLGVSSTDNIRICGLKNANFLKGVVDELRIYNRVLTDAEIGALSKR